MITNTPLITEITMVKLLKVLNPELRRVGFLKPDEPDFKVEDLKDFQTWGTKYRAAWGSKKDSEE